jgi:1-deoxy-D-xylulose-5-phosphate reductoisomerase
VHSMVEFVDGSFLAQLGVTDMRLPIQYAFTYPERWDASIPSLDLARCGSLEFEEPDRRRFPSLALAFRALAGDPGLPIVLNAANEIAVEAFLKERLRFQSIADVIQQSMDAYEEDGPRPVTSLEDVRAIDRWAREFSAGSTRGVQSKVQG